MGLITWHLATLQRLEPVGSDRDYGTGVPWRTRRVALGLRHRNTTVASPYDAGIGSDKPRSQQARLTRATTSHDPLIHLAAHVP